MSKKALKTQGNAALAWTPDESSTDAHAKRVVLREVPPPASDPPPETRPSQLPTYRAPASTSTIVRQPNVAKGGSASWMDSERAAKVREYVFRSRMGLADAGENYAKLRTLESDVFAPTDIPVLAMARSQIGVQFLDVRAQFILSLVDGRTTIAEIVTTSGMPHEDAMYAICDLTDHGVLKYR